MRQRAIILLMVVFLASGIGAWEANAFHHSSSSVRVGVVAAVNGLDLAPRSMKQADVPYYRTQLGVTILVLSGCVSFIYILVSLLMMVAIVRQSLPKERRLAARFTPPENLSPGLVGTILRSTPAKRRVIALLLILAQRGALVIEPDAKRKIQVRLLDGTRVEGAVEAALWNKLQGYANADHILDKSTLEGFRDQWGGEVRQMLNADMKAHGWIDETVGKRKGQLSVLGMVGIGLWFGQIFFSVALVGILDPQLVEGWGRGMVLADVLSLALALAAIAFSWILPRLSMQGEAVAHAWRAYRSGITRSLFNSEIQLDLDVALPYALAMGRAHWVSRRLKKASKAGFHPSWLSADASALTAYRMWTALIGIAGSRNNSE